MGTFIIAFQTVLPLFLLIFTGIIFSRIKKNGLQNWVEILNKYALWIGFPALVIYSLMQLKIEGNSFFGFVVLNSVFILGSMLLVFPVSRIFRFSVGMKRSLFLILPFGNVSYLGIPILMNAYGVEILPYAAIISAVYVFWLLTLAIFLIELYGHEKTEPKKLMLSLAENPLLLSVFIGLAIVLFKIPVPAFLGKTIQLFAESVTAVVLFSLGVFLGMQEIGKLRDWLQVAMWCLITMILLPFLFYQAIKLSSVNATNLKAIIIDAAMPLGVTPYVLAVQYKLKTTLIARIVVFGTLLSMVVIPLWMVILE